jgi:nucleoside-diphosphate-sugar epimerase
MVHAGRFRWIDGGRVMTSTTYIENLVHAVELALIKGRGGHAYFITDDETRTFHDFVSRLLLTQEVVVPRASIPGWMARPAARLIEALWRLLGIRTEPPITRMAIALMSTECTFSIAKARSELLYEPVVTFSEGLKQLALVSRPVR